MPANKFPNLPLLPLLSLLFLFPLIHCSQPQDLNLLSLFDTNSDTVIDKQQFTSYIQSQQEIRKQFGSDEEFQDSIDIAFMVYDTNGDKKLDGMQFQIFQQQMQVLKGQGQEGGQGQEEGQEKGQEGDRGDGGKQVDGAEGEVEDM